MDHLDDSEKAIWTQAYIKAEFARYHRDELLSHFAQKYKLSPNDSITDQGEIIRYEKTIEEKLVEFENARTDSD